MTVVDSVLEIYQSNVKICSTTKMTFDRLYRIYASDIIRISEDKKINWIEIIKRYEKRVKEEMPELYNSVGKKKLVKFIRITDYRFFGILQRIKVPTRRNGKLKWRKLV